MNSALDWLAHPSAMLFITDKAAPVIWPLSLKSLWNPGLALTDS
jgi:hypothetical protein